MAHLSKLKIVPAPAKHATTPEQARRDKLLIKLEEQLRMAEAELGGAPYERMKKVWITTDGGERKRVERAARLKTWWTKGPAGNVVLFVKYGSKPIELQKGRPAIDVGPVDKLSDVLKTVREAVKAGELDTEIGLAAAERKPGKRLK